MKTCLNDCFQQPALQSDEHCLHGCTFQERRWKIMCSSLFTGTHATDATVHSAEFCLISGQNFAFRWWFVQNESVWKNKSIQVKRKKSKIKVWSIIFILVLTAFNKVENPRLALTGLLEHKDGRSATPEDETSSQRWSGQGSSLPGFDTRRTPSQTGRTAWPPGEVTAWKRLDSIPLSV